MNKIVDDRPFNKIVYMIGCLTSAESEIRKDLICEIYNVRDYLRMIEIARSEKGK